VYSVPSTFRKRPVRPYSCLWSRSSTSGSWVTHHFFFFTHTDTLCASKSRIKVVFLPWTTGRRAWEQVVAKQDFDLGHFGMPPALVLHLFLSLTPFVTSAVLSTTPGSAKLHGVAPSKRSLYHPSDTATWKCLDGSKEIAWARVNDDFCDCADGSDEPGALPLGVTLEVERLRCEL